MQCEVKAVTEAYWEGELEGQLTTGAWIYFGSWSAGDVFFDTAECGAVNY